MSAQKDPEIWTHAALCTDLADHLNKNARRRCWVDTQLGPQGSPRPDVFTLQTSYLHPSPTAYECKVSAADFRSDVTSGKWQSYLEYAGAVFFCVPRGLVGGKDLPARVGLMVRGDHGWRATKGAVREVVTMPQDALMKLIIDGDRRLHREREPEPRSANAWKTAETIRKKFGDRVATVIKDLDYWERQVEGCKTRAQSITKRAGEDAQVLRAKNRRQYDEGLERIAAAWGIEDWESLTSYRWEAELERRALALDENQEIARLRLILRRVEEELQSVTTPIVQHVRNGSAP